MRSLKVLITTWTLALRGGSTLYVRDLALGLLARGHQPIVYSPIPGDVGNELRAATVPVVEHLSGVGCVPDLIHGNHHPELMTALLHFPGVPALHTCHAWATWDAAPPRFQRIRRYVAVNDTCRDWLIGEQGIPEARIQVLFNAVDLQRFVPRPPLPLRPRRALVFSNYASEQSYSSAVREACERAGLELHVVGAGAGNPCARPEAILGDYDLVFAKARCALEALAVGTAVVLCDALGAGPLVTAANWRQLRRLNLGRRTLREPVRADVLLPAIQRYDAQDAAEVSRGIRAAAGLDTAIEEMLTLYRQILDEHTNAPPADPVAELRAAAVYLNWLAPTAKSAGALDAERRQLAAEVALAQSRCEQLQQQLTQTGQRQAQLDLQLAEAAAALDSERRHRSADAVQTQERCAAWQEQLAQSGQRRVQLEQQRAAAETALDDERGRLAEVVGQAHHRCARLEQLLDQAGRRQAQVEQDRDRLQAALSAVANSTTLRVRNRLLRLPVLGSLLRWTAHLRRRAG